MTITVIVLLTSALLVLLGMVYDLRNRVTDLENQADADLRLAAWEARLRASEERLLDTTIRCEAREMERSWNDHNHSQGSAKK